MKKLIALILVISLTALCFAACSNNKETAQENQTAAAESNDGKRPVVTMEIQDKGTVKMELYPDKAPNTVKNFISLTQKGFYDGIIFHRVIAGFMIQGGDPEGSGFGGPGYCIKGECTSNGVNNDLRNDIGYLAMARSSGSYDTAGSQFYINVADNDFLNGEYTVFGCVIEGMDIVNEISKVTTNNSDKPLNNVVIAKMTVETFGIDYGEPETLPDK